MPLFDGMIDNRAINESIVRPLIESTISHPTAQSIASSVLQINDVTLAPDTDSMLSSLLYGDTVILTDGDSRPIVVNSKGFAQRSPSEPESEKVLRGPREGFTESFMTNLSRLRLSVNDPRLTFSFARYAGCTNTVICVCWIKGITPPALVQEMQC